MPSPVKFRLLTDEMIHRDVVRMLIASGCDVLKCPKGLKNGDVYQLAKREERFLITQDKDFSDPRRYPPSDTSGIVCVRVFPPTIANLLSGIKTFIHEKKPDDIKGRLIILK